MSIINRLMQRWRKPQAAAAATTHPFAAQLSPGHSLVPAFCAQGVQYWKFANEFNLPFERAQAAFAVLEELEMGVDRHYLQATAAAVKIHLEAGKLSEAWRWLHELDERLNWPVDADLVYRLAAVVFFDKDENPYAYDPAKAREKIQRWRTQDAEAEMLRDFFLSLGLMDYWGPLQDAEVDLLAYTATQRKVKLKQLSALCTQLYDKAKTADWHNCLRQQATDLKALQPSDS